MTDTTPAAMSDDMTRQFLQAAADMTWNAHDPAALAANMAADAVMQVVPLDEHYEGRGGLQELAESRLASFPDWHIDIVDGFMTADRICARLTLTGTHQGEFLGHEATGRPFEVDVCSAFRMRDGQMVEEFIYFDLAGWLRQLGITDIGDE